MHSSTLQLEQHTVRASRWPRRFALALVCATFPLIWIGGLVTSYKAGMAVHDWPTTFGYNMFAYPIAEWLAGPFDIFIEHAHRLFASLVGLLTIAVAVVCWRCDKRPSVRVLSLIILAGVIAQGLLGGLRVLADARTLAMVHGCFAQAFFGMTIALAAILATWWPAAAAADEGLPDREEFARLSRLARLAVLTSIIAYLQIVLGAVLRHFQLALLPHLFVAVVLLFHIGWLVFRSRQMTYRRGLFTRPATMLVALVLIQLVLGISTWITNRGWPIWFEDYAFASGYVVVADSPLQIFMKTAHVAVGASLFATTVSLSLRSMRVRRLAVLAGVAAAPATEAKRVMRMSISQRVGAAAVEGAQ